MKATKALKKTLIASCCLVAFMIFLTLVLTPLVRMRQASVKPLNAETLAELGIAAPDEADLPRVSSVSADASGADTSKDANTTESLSSSAKSRPSLRLARPATAADARSRYRGYSGRWDRAFTGAWLGALKRVESAVWLVKPGSTGSFAIEIGSESFQMGDFTTARNYLREALRTGKRDFSREWICSWLAWLEEDPEVATALLQESCASGNALSLRDAMHLAIFTNSDDLADYYFKRWSDAAGTEEVAQWFKFFSLYPKVQEWKQRHAPNPPIEKGR
jgi:hypothetical protein